MINLHVRRYIRRWPTVSHLSKYRWPRGWKLHRFHGLFPGNKRVSRDHGARRLGVPTKPLRFGARFLQPLESIESESCQKEGKCVLRPQMCMLGFSMSIGNRSLPTVCLLADNPSAKHCSQLEPCDMRRNSRTEFAADLTHCPYFVV